MPLKVVAGLSMSRVRSSPSSRPPENFKGAQVLHLELFLSGDGAPTRIKKVPHPIQTVAALCSSVVPFERPSSSKADLDLQVMGS